MEQSWPVQLGSQLQVPVSARKAPCPEHWSMQEARGLSHPGPPQPTKQWHSPWTQTPRPEHVGSRQSTTKRFQRDSVRHRPPAASTSREHGVSLFTSLSVKWQLPTWFCFSFKKQNKTTKRLHKEKQLKNTKMGCTFYKKKRSYCVIYKQTNYTLWCLEKKGVPS